MREYKFRGKSTTDLKWYFGNLICLHNDNKEIDRARIMTPSLWVEDVIIRTVGQYIGLCDRFGREIYEGDIVECGSGRICQVVFFKSECACCFDLSPVGGFDCEPPKVSTLWKDLIVIGNVHDNPELLEVDA